MRKTPREVYRKKKELFVLTDLQRSVLIGTVLGDAGIRYRGKECRMHIKHAASQLELVLYKHQTFSAITAMPVNVFVQKIRAKNYSFAEFVTLTHPVFTSYYQLFYQNGIKTVPENIDSLLVDPVSLAMLIMDDGAAEYAGLSIQTHSFSKAEVVRLSEAIYHNFGLATTIRSNRGKYILYFPQECMDKLRALVGKHVLPSLSYKLYPYNLRYNPVETARRNPPRKFEDHDTVRSLR